MCVCVYIYVYICVCVCVFDFCEQITIMIFTLLPKYCHRLHFFFIIRLCVPKGSFEKDWEIIINLLCP